MKATQFVDRLKKIATEYDTLYVYGCIGSLLTLQNYTRYTSKYKYNQKEALRENYKKAIENGDTFGFDCVCLVKSVLWGWNGNKNHVYGGADYETNNVPDKNVDGIFELCTDISADFTNILPGEYLYMDGHCGVYIGDGLAVECTPIWKNGVQITAVANMGAKSGYNSRKWLKHGKLPWVEYEDIKTEIKYDVNIGLNILKNGSKGDQVKTLQRILMALGYSMGGYGADGAFGTTTEKAVKAYQKSKGLTVDGVVGTNTWTKLLRGG